MANSHDTEYLQTIKGLLDYGRPSSDRTGTGTIKAAGLSMRFHMDNDFPLLTSKFVPLKMIERENRMFMNGITNNDFLAREGINIWTPFANKSGELGPVYGAMWRRWPGVMRKIDQIEELMKGLREKPMSRRHIVTGWNPDFLPIEGYSHAENVDAGFQALPPCHTMWQVHVFELSLEERLELKPDGVSGVSLGIWKTEVELYRNLDLLGVPKYGVSLQLFQRSADMFLGVPFNIASYSLILHYIAASLNMVPFEFIWNGGDCHIYNDHIEQMKEQLARIDDAPASPTLRIKNPKRDLWDYTIDDIELLDYHPMSAIKGKMSV